MATHDFRRLSALDFEELIHDLLQAHWKQPLEAFKTGADQGIDLRHTSAGDGTTIVQCKHYVGSGFSKLRSVLRNEELPKVQKLAPSRYVLATSVPLSPGEKDKIKADLAPYILSTDDIVGHENVEALLRANPDVEKTHYKLWLTSSAILEKVVHAAEACKTEFQLDRITAKLPLYVQNSAYPKALKILQDEKVVIISGEPGIGKTTLAEMLIYAHLADGYVPAMIESEVSEGRKVFSKGRKSIFYFDDFLGQTYLGDRPDYTGRNQDLALVEFMEMIRASDSRFILTTREHILSGALQRSERLSQSGFGAHKCVLELADYSREQRARILYNHLAFSNLDQAYRDELVKDSFFLKVVDHRHFNPRVIDWVTSEPRLKGVDATGYRNHVASVIDDPTAIWRHAFESQISVASRYLLLALYTSGTSASLAELQIAWSSLFDHAARKYNFSQKPNEFREAVKELTGGFISFHGQNVRFLNPSVRDYVATVFATSRDFVLDIAASAVRIRQIAALFNLGMTKHPAITNWLIENPEDLSARIAPLITDKYYRFHHGAMGLDLEHYELNLREQVEFIVRLAEAGQKPAFAALLADAVDFALARWEAVFIDIPSAVGMLEAISDADWLATHGGKQQSARIEAMILESLDQGSAGDWLSVLDGRSDTVLASDAAKEAVGQGFKRYLSHGLARDEDNCSDASDYTALAENLVSIASRHEIDLTAKIEELQELAADRERDDDARDSVGSTRVPASASAPAPPVATDEQLRQMFNSLI